MPSNIRLTGAQLLFLTVKGEFGGVKLGALVTRRKFESEACRWLTPEEARNLAKELLSAADVAELRGED